ncbi:glycoside hydrolase family 30 protein [Cerasicoccus maritimus]|uniref:glycoside hydrolase family 30 protein n=1 Tax=Cerasicoccus maritimus TaxID=490089 RepID=UPI0028528F07|nr:glycoside hydrolase family 30 protein [Cerasicoccus maritimus]
MTKLTSLMALSASVILTSSGAAADVEIYQTTRQGDRLDKVEAQATGSASYTLTLNPDKTFQTLVGIGGSFTESGAQVLSELSKTKRELALRSYFSPSGARISLTRTHIASSDFSVTNYTYAPVPGDKDLKHFSIEPDHKYLLPMIKEAQGIAGAEFKILSSPWTPPPWMKTNNHWNGGNLKREYYQTFSDYIVKYIQAYEAEGIPIWGITPANEPLGNGNNWESVHFSAHEMSNFIADYLGPTLEKHVPDLKVWAYDQNRGHHLVEWAEAILGNPKSAKYVDGMAVHWYQSTVDVGAESLDEVHAKFPDKQILHSEGCIDAMGDDEEIGVWLEDDWYWRPEASDWGYIWAADDDKVNHPKYRPFYRYARDLIGGFNHHLVGWVDWNMFLNTRGGPNHARNYCLAPILVDSGKDSFYRTPLFYAMAHFSRYMRPGAKRIELTGHDETLMATAFQNPDQSIAVAVFNTSEEPINYDLSFFGRGKKTILIPGQALQTVVIKQ